MTANAQQSQQGRWPVVHLVNATGLPHHVDRWSEIGWELVTAKEIGDLEIWTLRLPEEVRASCPELAVRDRNGARLRAGDLVESTRVWMKGDGYLPKQAPKEIRTVCAVVWVSHHGAFEAWQVGVSPEHANHAAARTYRGMSHWDGFKVSYLRDPRSGCYSASLGRRPDMGCDDFLKWEDDAGYACANENGIRGRVFAKPWSTELR